MANNDEYNDEYLCREFLSASIFDRGFEVIIPDIRISRLLGLNEASMSHPTLLDDVGSTSWLRLKRRLGHG